MSVRRIRITQQAMLIVVGLVFDNYEGGMRSAYVWRQMACDNIYVTESECYSLVGVFGDIHQLVLRGRTFAFDEERRDRPIKITTDDFINRFGDIVLADYRVKIGGIAQMANISVEREFSIFREKMECKKAIGETGTTSADD
ncbi:hypothetical protein Trydic_g787 [Trypoxylus dichotomus]